jgi:DNA-binding response OmpR family regulator
VQQPDILSHKAVPAATRHLRVVTADEQPPQSLVAYVVLAPGHLAPEDLFSPLVDVTARPTGAHLPAQQAASPARTSSTAPDDGVHVDRQGRTAHVDGRRLDLTYLEFELLAHLVANPRVVHSRSRLLQVIWGYDHVGDGRTVDVHVARLRRKLGPVHREAVRTVRRVGYQYVPRA